MLGEEAFFTKKGRGRYKEDAWVESGDACVLQVRADCMHDLRIDRFMDKGPN